MDALIEKQLNLIDVYLNDTSWLTKENANKFDSYTKLRGFVADRYISDYVLDNFYPSEVVDAHKRGDIYIHNLSDGIVPYCKGHDARKLLLRGLVTNTVAAKPPRHYGSFLSQLFNYLATSQQSWAGAQAVSNLNTLAAPFVHRDKNSLTEIVQATQNFMFDSNFPSRGGSQTPFLNVTFNFQCPKFLAEEDVISDGFEGTYGDYEEESLLILKAFNTLYYGGDALKQPFTFPIPTINLIEETPFDDPLWEDLIKTTIKYGTYSFFNYIGTGIDPNTILAMCCRLQIDLTELAPSGGRWAYGGETGSIGVVTLNLGRLGYLAKDEEDLFVRLNEILQLAKVALLCKGVNIELNKKKLMPLDIIYGTDLTRFFRTIGILGLNEMCINFFGTPLSENVDFAKKFLMYIRDWTKRTQMETGLLWNFEMTPAESCAHNIAEKDKNNYNSDIFTQGVEGAWYYTSMLTPPNQELSLMERIKVEEPLIPLFTGGTIHRMYIGEAVPDITALKNLTERIARNTKITYYDFATTYSTCTTEDGAGNACGEIRRGVVDKCPVCDGNMLTWDRIVGYYRPRTNANIGRLQEIKERRYVRL